MRGLERIRDSYSAQVWLTGEQVAHLNSLFPDDELEVQLGKLVTRSMRQTQRRAASSTPRQAARTVERIEPTPQKPIPQAPPLLPPAAMATPPRRPANLPKLTDGTPLSRLNQFCQKSKANPPEPAIDAVVGGFHCRYVLLGRSGEGQATTKKEAMQAAAAQLLESLGY